MNQAHFSSKHHQQGSTLVEVLVSVFLLTFGVLGLMAAQLRSVASISEAENRNAVALAAENLADGMQFNPAVEQLTTPSGQNVVRRYPNYLTTGGVKQLDLSRTIDLPKPLVNTNPNDSASNITKDQVAAYQLGVFEHGLMQLPNVVDIQYAICLDNADGEPTYNNGRMEPNCSATGGAVARTVIKVLWVVRGENATSEPVIFTYKLHVAQ